MGGFPKLGTEVHFSPAAQRKPGRRGSDRVFRHLVDSGQVPDQRADPLGPRATMACFSASVLALASRSRSFFNLTRRRPPACANSRDRSIRPTVSTLSRQEMCVWGKGQRLDGRFAQVNQGPWNRVQGTWWGVQRGNAPLPAGGRLVGNRRKECGVQREHGCRRAPHQPAGIAERAVSPQRRYHKGDIRCEPRFLMARPPAARGRVPSTPGRRGTLGLSCGTPRGRNGP